MQLLHMRTQCTRRHIPESTHLPFPQRFDRTGTAVFELEVGSKVACIRRAFRPKYQLDEFLRAKKMEESLPKWANMGKWFIYLVTYPFVKVWVLSEQIGISAYPQALSFPPTALPPRYPNQRLPRDFQGSNGWDSANGFGLSLFKKTPQKMDKKYHGDD